MINFNTLWHSLCFESLDVECCSYNCPQYKTCCLLPTELYYTHEHKNIDILFVGQGGGKQEEKQRRPFVGPSGKRLTSWISYLWENVKFFTVGYTNTVRCHPINENGKDRVPNNEEWKECSFYIERDIHNIKPKVIIPLGTSSTHLLLPQTKNKRIGQLRGTIIEHYDQLYVPTYHPSYILKQGGNKFTPDNIHEREKHVLLDIALSINLLNKRKELQ